jgi:tRNA dimethylallyltransferase
LKPLLVIIGGPTGIGKTATAIKLAKYFNTEIISADSRQFYKELSIGTAVPTREELMQVKHHFIHNLSVKEDYNASQFEFDALRKLDELFAKHRIVIMVGGSGLYIDALCNGIDDLPTIRKEVRDKFEVLFQKEGIEEIRKRVKAIDPDYYKMVDIHNHKRMLKALEVYDMTGKPYSSLLKRTKKERPFDVLKIILDMNRETLYERINIRVDKMIESGLIEESRTMLPYRTKTPLKTVGYKELFEYFDGNMELHEAITKIKNHSRAYARRQLTWFRRYPDAKWFHPDNIKKMIHSIHQALQP